MNKVDLEPLACEDGDFGTSSICTKACYNVLAEISSKARVRVIIYIHSLCIGASKALMSAHLPEPSLLEHQNLMCWLIYDMMPTNDFL